MAGTPAKTILTKSLAEIEGGNWKKGTWGVGKKNGKCSLEMGCAMGMVAIYGGEYNEERGAFYQDGSYFDSRELPKGAVYVTPRVPGSNSSNGVRKAVAALYSALPVSFIRERFGSYLDATDLSTGDMVGACVEYNDRDTTGQGRAASWFRKAIETLPSVKTPAA